MEETRPRGKKCEPTTHGPQAIAVEKFLESKRVALVGISHKSGHFSQALLQEMRAHGLDVALVNPNGGALEGAPVFKSLAEVQPPVEAVYVATPPHATLDVMKECTALGIDKIWLHRGTGHGAVSPEAVEYAADPDRQVVVGQCILMYLEPVHWVHKVHKGIKKAMGTLPA